jgi:hypothetical protein
MNDLQKFILNVHGHFSGHTDKPATQEEASRSMIRRFEGAKKHVEKLGSNYDVVFVAAKVLKIIEDAYILDLVNGGISTLKLNASGTPYCLYVDSSNNGKVGLRLCSRVDQSQRLLWRSDYTIRPVQTPSQCLTVDQEGQNGPTLGIRHVFLRQCVSDGNSLNSFQRFAYYGEAPGNPFVGMIVWGNGIAELAVVSKKQ